MWCAVPWCVECLHLCTLLLLLLLLVGTLPLLLLLLFQVMLHTCNCCWRGLSTVDSRRIWKMTDTVFSRARENVAVSDNFFTWKFFGGRWVNFLLFFWKVRANSLLPGVLSCPREYSNCCCWWIFGWRHGCCRRVGVVDVIGDIGGRIWCDGCCCGIGFVFCVLARLQRRRWSVVRGEICWSFERRNSDLGNRSCFPPGVARLTGRKPTNDERQMEGGGSGHLWFYSQGGLSILRSRWLFRPLWSSCNASPSWFGNCWCCWTTWVHHMLFHAMYHPIHSTRHSYGEGKQNIGHHKPLSNKRLEDLLYWQPRCHWTRAIQYDDWWLS